MDRIYLSPPHIGPDELALVTEAFSTNWMAPVGPHVDAFEAEFAVYVGAEHAVTLSSGTAAPHLALQDLRDVVLLFLGCFSRYKGVANLFWAFVGTVGPRPERQLMIVGPGEEMRAEIEQNTATVGEHVRFVGYTPASRRFMAAADLFCLPRYRKGFGSVVMKASAAGIPAIVSRSYGVVDAVEEGASGRVIVVVSTPTERSSRITPTYAGGLASRLFNGLTTFSKLKEWSRP